MKKLLLFILLTPLIVHAQAQRYDSFSSTTTSASGIGNLLQAIPNATITVFNAPAAGVSCAGGGCVAATTYTSNTGVTACGAGVPLTRPTSNTCLSTADAQGNFGFWAVSGSYQYCIAATNFTTTCFNTVLGVGTVNSLNGTVYVDGIKYACSASGFNSAIAALPAAGGIVDATGCTSNITGQTTTVNVGSGTQFVFFKMPSATYSGSASPLFLVHLRSILYIPITGTIQQTANAGNGVILAGSGGGNALTGGIQGNGVILGPGSSSTANGLIIGGSADTSTSNFANYVYIGQIRIMGFALGVELGYNAYQIKFDHTQLYSTTASNVPLGWISAATGSGENIYFDHVNFAASPNYQTMTINPSSGTEMYFLGCSFDGVFVNINPSSGLSRIWFETPHFEAVNGATNTDFITTSGAGEIHVWMDAGIMQEDTVSTRTEFITHGSGTLHIYGTRFNPQETVTTVIAASGSATTEIYGIATNNLSNTITGGGSSILCALSIPGNGNPQCRINGNVLPQVIAASTATMTTASIAAVSGTTITCGATVTVSATGVATTDTITFAPSAAPTSPNTGLIIQAWPTANNVNFAYCNPTASALTPGAETLNFRVMR